MSLDYRKRKDYWTDLRDLLCINLHSQTIYGFKYAVDCIKEPIIGISYGCTIRKNGYVQAIGVAPGKPNDRTGVVKLVSFGPWGCREIILKRFKKLSETVMKRHPDYIYAFFVGANQEGLSSLPFLEMRENNRKEMLRACIGGEEANNPLWSPTPMLIDLEKYAQENFSKSFKVKSLKESESLSISLELF